MTTAAYIFRLISSPESAHRRDFITGSSLRLTSLLEGGGLRSPSRQGQGERLAAGLQGVDVAECATQPALAYARERRQARTAGMKAETSVPIIAHPDIPRILLSMRALTQAARAVWYTVALVFDRTERHTDDGARQRARYQFQCLLFTRYRKCRTGLHTLKLGLLQTNFAGSLTLGSSEGFPEQRKRPEETGSVWLKHKGFELTNVRMA